MKRFFTIVSFLAASQAVSSMAGVNVGINVGGPPVVVAPPPRPQIVTPAPPPMRGGVPNVVFNSQPRFIFSPDLGFYVTIGAPYDMVYMDNSYYFNSGGLWYTGPSYSGPWRVARGSALPRALRRNQNKIGYYRDREYQMYQKNPGRYRGKLYEPQWNRRR